MIPGSAVGRPRSRTRRSVAAQSIPVCQNDPPRERAPAVTRRQVPQETWTAARARWREQSLAWLRAELEGRPKVLTLSHWQHDPDLVGVREDLEKLPEAEREQWRAFWSEVEEALDR